MSVQRFNALKNETDIELRLLKASDAEELYDLVVRNYDYLREWVPLPAEGADFKQDITKFIDDGVKTYLAFRGVHFGLFYRGRLGGVMELHHADWANKCIKVGFWIDSAFQGRGIVTRACRVLVDFSFGELEMHRVEMACAVENVKSQSVAAKLGFHKEGVIRHAEFVNYRYRDHVIYGMLEDEWRNNPFYAIGKKEAV